MNRNTRTGARVCFKTYVARSFGRNEKMRKINVAVFIIIVIIMPVTFRLVHPTSYNKRKCVFTTIIVDVVVEPTTIMRRVTIIPQSNP